MSYTHIHLPELDVLKQRVEQRPEILKYYSKYGAIMGPSDSVDYLEKKIQKYLKNN